MAEVAVVGAGLGGLATAARLAKLGHRVTVVERGSAPGGLLGQVSHDGHTWDATPMQTTVPAVLRDLFRKSGRPLERYVDLELSTPARRHVFADGVALDLPTGSRGGQLGAVSDALGAAAGAAWTRFVDDQADLWAALRADVLDPPDGASRLGERRVARTLHVRRSLDRLLRKGFDDVRLRQLAGFTAGRAGPDASVEPAFRAVEPYVERSFGVWRAPGGAADLADALLRRMDERSVQLRFDIEVTSLRVQDDTVTGLVLADGSCRGVDLVVTAISPRQVFGRLLDHPVARAAVPAFMPDPGAARPAVTYLGLSGTIPALPAELVLHGDPLLAVATDGRTTSHTTGNAIGLSVGWTVTAYSPPQGQPVGPVDVLHLMAQRGLDIRHLVTTRLDGQGPLPVPTWAGARTAVRRAALARPLPGLQCLGTSLVLGASVPYVAWQAAHVAETLGKA